MAKRATRRQQRSVDSSVDEIAAIPRSQRQFRTADHPLLSRLLRESSRENTIAILRLSTLLSPLIICQSLLVSVSFDDHASSVIHVPHTRAEQISILRRHLRSTWFRPPSLPPSLATYRAPRIARQREISISRETRSGELRAAAGTVRARTHVRLARAQVARGTFRRETSPEEREHNEKCAERNKGPSHNGVTRNGVRVGPLSALCPR